MLEGKAMLCSEWWSNGGGVNGPFPRSISDWECVDWTRASSKIAPGEVHMKITTMRMVLEFWSEEVYIDLSLVTDRCVALLLDLRI
jgi:hypothetical protein